MNFYLEKMIELGADGVDFHAFVAKPPNCYIFQSNTKEDFINGNILTPRSGYTFWKRENGEKKYIYSKRNERNEVAQSAKQSFVFGDKVVFTSHQNQDLQTPCIFIRDDDGKAVIIFENAEWVARVNYHSLSKERS